MLFEWFEVLGVDLFVIIWCIYLVNILYLIFILFFCCLFLMIVWSIVWGIREIVNDWLLILKIVRFVLFMEIDFFNIINLWSLGLIWIL